MMAQHSAMLHALCPVNGAWDYYSVHVETDALIFVETIEAALNDLRGSRATQEGIAQQLADKLGCRVRLTGRHGTMDSVVDTLPRLSHNPAR